MPNLKIKTLTSGSKKWLANFHGVDTAITGILKISTFTPVDGYIPSGTAVKVGTDGDYELSTGGAQPVAGHLRNDVVPGTDVRVAAAIQVHGTVIAAKVPGTFTKPTTANQIAYI